MSFFSFYDLRFFFIFYVHCTYCILYILSRYIKRFFKDTRPCFSFNNAIIKLLMLLEFSNFKFLYFKIILFSNTKILKTIYVFCEFHEN